MKIFQLPYSVPLKKSILWQYEKAERLKMLSQMFDDMLELCAVRPWRIITKSLNLDSTEFEWWDNYNAPYSTDVADQVLNGDRVVFTPESVGMGIGDAIRSVRLTTRTRAASAYPLGGNWKLALAPHADAYNANSVLETSETVSINDGDVNAEFEFEFLRNETELIPSNTYDLWFLKEYNGQFVVWNGVSNKGLGLKCWYTIGQYGIPYYYSRGKDALGNDYTAITTQVLRPIIAVQRRDHEIKSSEERALGMISTLFGIEKPTYEGDTRPISLDIWKRYIKSRIYLMDCNGSCADLNAWLKIVFPDVELSVQDNLDMTISYPHLEQLEGEDVYLSQIKDFFPHPSGVLVGEEVHEDRILALQRDEGYDTESDAGTLNESRFYEPPQP